MNPQPKLDSQSASININDLENWMNLSISSMKYYSSKKWMWYQSISALALCIFVHKKSQIVKVFFQVSLERITYNCNKVGEKKDGKLDTGLSLLHV